MHGGLNYAISRRVLVMPIKVEKDEISGRFSMLGASISTLAKEAATSASAETKTNIINRVLAGEFWTNRSYNASKHIGSEVEAIDGKISVAVGFQANKPNEADAPEYYKGRDREYAQYIADRENTRFTSHILQTLISNIVRSFGAIGMKVNRMSSSASMRNHK